jgi:polyhydroxyalkanoate synthesis regulator phasin
MNKMIKQPLAIATLAAAMICVPGIASAQSPNNAPAATAQQPQAQISEDKVDKFVDAYVEVQKINQEYTAQLQATGEPAKATELQQEAQTKMQEAVTDTGLSIPEYQQIAALAGQDQELRSRIEKELSK